MQWLMIFRQLNSYMFSGENSFGNDEGSPFLSTGIDHKRRQSYVVGSEMLPPQATLLGTVRYLMLKESGILKPDWNYTGDDRKRMNKLIGSCSFSLDQEEQNDMGAIKWVSPVFLASMDGEGPAHAYIPAPLDAAPKQAEAGKYVPMIEEYQDHGISLDNQKGNHTPGQLWRLMGFDAKDFPKPGLLRCDIACKDEEYSFGTMGDDWTSLYEWFDELEMPGIRIPEYVGDDNKSYHIQKRRRLKGACFAAVVCIDEGFEFVNKDLGVVTMGGRGSLFYAQALRWRANNDDAFSPPLPPCSRGIRAYLTAPARLPKKHADNYEHALIMTRTVRNGRADGQGGIALSDTRYTFADTGSVFFFKNEGQRNRYIEKITQDNACVAGYNHAVKYGK